VKKGQRVKLFHTNKTYEVKEVGVFTPKMTARDKLVAGDVGYVIANMKSADEAKIGDTLTDNTHPCPEPLPGYKEIQPMVFSGIYPVESSDYEALKTAMGKLQINDAAFTYMSESSTALGFGFRCGFLGLLHMEIIQERLRREFNMDVISTYPSVIYQVTLTDGSEVIVDNPTFFPEQQMIQEIREPVVNVYIMVPGEYIGDMMQLVLEKRGEVTNTETIDDMRVMLSCVLPLSEILVDFNDKLKSMTRGYGSMDYEHAGYRAAKMVKMDMLIAGDPVEAFSTIVHRDKAESYGRVLAGKLKEVIPPTSSSSPSRPPSAARSSPANRSPPCAKTSPPNATAATSPANASSSKSKRRARKKMKMFRLKGQHPAGRLHQGAQAHLLPAT
jgi:GTP-binding protein LepA